MYILVDCQTYPQPLKYTIFYDICHTTTKTQHDHYLSFFAFIYSYWGSWKVHFIISANFILYFTGKTNTYSKDINKYQAVIKRIGKQYIIRQWCQQLNVVGRVWNMDITSSCCYILQFICTGFFYTDSHQLLQTYKRPDAAAWAISVSAACCVSRRIRVSFIQSWATLRAAPFKRFMYRNVMLKSPLSIQYLKCKINVTYSRLIFNFLFSPFMKYHPQLGMFK